jgi:hypothetical protein
MSTHRARLAFCSPSSNGPVLGSFGLLVHTTKKTGGRAHSPADPIDHMNRKSLGS